MKTVYLIIILFGFKVVYAHNPDLSSLMIYEQNGKTILLINSSLTAFEGEVDYIYGKEAYKTPEAFNQLVIQLLQRNCFLIADGDTIKFTNIQVQLGHETNLFAELETVPKTIKTLYVRNTLFKDMHHNQCELILTINGLPKKQYILNNDNQQEVRLKVEDNKWVEDDSAKAFYLHPIFLIGVVILLIAFIASTIVFTAKRKKH